MSKLRTYLNQHWFLILAFLIVLLAFFLRFYDYWNRWGLAYDQAHGAIIARYALENHELPLVGPFSSAGPFQTGGEWYWFIMAGTIFNTNSVISPWILLSLTSVLFVALMIVVGKELVNRKFGLMVGALSAVSTSQIAQSFNLTNQSVIAPVALLAIWSCIRFIRERKTRYMFFIGLFTSLAVTIHLQGTALIIFVIAMIIFTGIPRLKHVVALFLGLLIPIMPILIFDLKSNFVNIKNMIYYYLYDQYKISFEALGRRWFTYLGSFWPDALSHILGGNKILSYIMLLGGFGVYVLNLKKKSYLEWNILFISFILMVAYLRYVRTPLFDSYLMFLHPFIFLITGWTIWYLYKKSSAIASIFLIIILVGSLYKDFLEIKSAQNNSSKDAETQVKVLLNKFPSEKFSVYSYKYNWADKNLILSLYLYAQGKIDDNGKRVGLVIATKSAEFDTFPVISGDLGYRLIDLSSSSSSQLAKGEWARVNPKDIYQATQEWYKIKK